MTKKMKYVLILSILILVCILPIISSLLVNGTVPDGFGLFPAQLVDSPPGFSRLYFTLFSLFALFLTLFLSFPRIFGFKKNNTSPTATSSKNAVDVPAQKRSFPWWFWPSFLITVLSWFFMWARIPALYPLEHYTFVPLAWGFIMVLDGIVYRRNGGKSLMSCRGTQMKLMVLVSMLSWFLFEYFNYFVNENWYYPNHSIFTSFGNILWFFLGYSTVLPVIFEWYTLLNTFPALARRYADGPILKPGKAVKIIILISGLALFFCMSLAPYILFWAVWVALIPIFGAAFSLINRPTVLSGIAVGNWSDVNLIAIATLLNGFIWELWNFGSEWFHDYYPTTPGYWKYSVPYVDVVHLFSEMPLLGYFGYLFFGVNCWILWNLAAYLLKFDDVIEL